MMRETVRTASGKRVTMQDVIRAMSSENAGSRFPVNYAVNQYGPVLAKRIVALMLDGHEITVAQASEGFFIDGTYQSCRDLLGRDWWK